MFELGINYLALIVAGAANMAIGMLWYGPLFGKKWMALSGFTEESMKQMPLKPWQAMVGGVFISLITAYFLLLFVVGWTASITGALVLAFWVWLGFVVTTQAQGFLWEGKPLSLFIINTTYSLVAYGVMASILFLWQ